MSAAEPSIPGPTSRQIDVVFPPLYAIIDAGLVKTSELSFAEMMAESGVAILQYRSKHATSRQLFDICAVLAREWPRLVAHSPVGKPPQAPRFIVNDRADIAALVGAGGVHVGQTDLGVEQARAIAGPHSWVGISTHNPEQVAAAEPTSADYIAFGPIFPTTTKERPDRVVGLDLLAQARRRTRKPLVAIGGITLERAEAVYRAGADSLAVTRDLMAAADPAARARAFLQAAARVKDGNRGGAASR
jgi:thiamine-phosphate pyrophosphorylase